MLSSENIYALLSEPVFKGLLYGTIRELFKPRRDEKLLDESIGSFVSRRFGSSVADNLVSAVVHGVYAGDIYQLSARSIAARFWRLESEYQSVIKGLWKERRGSSSPTGGEHRDPILGPPIVNVKDLSVFSFVGGLEELTHAITAELAKNPNVWILLKTKVQSMKKSRNKV